MVILPVILALQSSTAPEVTVYNGGFGFVKEVRSLTLKAGVQSVAVADVPSLIETNSVAIRSLTSAGSFDVLEQNYQYDLINAQAILDKAVGGRIRLHRVLPNGQKEVVEGTLMSSPTAIVNGGTTYNGMVIQTLDGRILINPTGEIEVTSIPDGMISKPTLLWLLDSHRAGSNQIELSYLTQGMNWSSDYVMTLGESSKADFRGWVTLNNNSGAPYKNAKLKLIAGDVNRVTNIPGNFARSKNKAPFEMSAMAAPFKEESLFEYHLYTLQRPATLKNNEQKQVSLLEATGITYQKKLIVDSMMNFGMYYPSEGAIGVGDIKPLVKVEFLNKKENNLGMALPKGKVKVYQRDKSGSVQMVGEDQIDHTPKDERISLTIGRSFDVRATRKAPLRESGTAATPPTGRGNRGFDEISGVNARVFRCRQQQGHGVRRGGSKHGFPLRHKGLRPCPHGFIDRSFVHKQAHSRGIRLRRGPQLPAFPLRQFHRKLLRGLFESLGAIQLSSQHHRGLFRRDAQQTRNFLQRTEVRARMTQGAMAANELQPHVASDLFDTANQNRTNLRGRAHVRSATGAAVKAINRHYTQRPGSLRGFAQTHHYVGVFEGYGHRPRVAHNLGTPLFCLLQAAGLNRRDFNVDGRYFRSHVKTNRGNLEQLFEHGGEQMLPGVLLHVIEAALPIDLSGNVLVL
ncbi:MAG: hypothetical protein ABL962_01415 [Fimbriimonadaceae bacterium]